MSRALAIVGAAALAMACSGPRESVATELWPEPVGNRPALATVPSGHPLRDVVAAFEAGECEAGVAASAALMRTVEARVQAVFHGAEGSGEGAGSALAAAGMRDLLDEYVYAAPPLLEIGDHRFTFPRWWVDDYAYCLTALGRYGDAAEVYIQRLQDELDAESLWRLALAYAWDDRREQALGVLEAWPQGLEQPAALPDVLARLRSGREVPRQLAIGEAQ